VRTLALLRDALEAQTGREGLARALASLAPPEAEDLLDLLVLNPDSVVRAAALEVLGDRQEEALRPTLLKVCRDPISDIALRTLFHLGRLPNAEGLAHRILDGGKPEDLQTGLRFIGMHRLSGLVTRVLDLLATQHREDLILEALEALAAVGSAQAGPPLLAQLGTGLTGRLQIAYAQTIRDLQDEATTDALATRALEARNASLQAVAVEAIAKVHEAGHPLDAPGSARLETLVREAWKDGNPWPLRLRIARALGTVEVEDAVFWSRMYALFTEALSEKRSQTTLTPEELATFQAAGKHFLQRSAT